MTRRLENLSYEKLRELELFDQEKRKLQQHLKAALQYPQGWRLCINHLMSLTVSWKDPKAG